MTRLTEEQSQLAAEHYTLALKIAKRKAGQCPGLEDKLISGAMLGLCDAAAKYTESRGKFETYAYPRILGSALDELRRERLRGYQSRSIGDQAPPVIPIDGVIVASDHGPIGWELESIDAVISIAARVPSQGRRVIILRYCYGLSMDEIASRLELSQARVSKIHEQSLQILRGDATSKASKPPKVRLTTSEPCHDCGTTGGNIKPRCHRPSRMRGEVVGQTGVLCRNCYDRLRKRKPNSRRTA